MTKIIEISRDPDALLTVAEVAALGVIQTGDVGLHSHRALLTCCRA